MLGFPLDDASQGQRGFGGPCPGGRLHGFVDPLAADDAILVIAEQILERRRGLDQAAGRLAIHGFEELGRVAQPFGADARLVEARRRCAVAQSIGTLA